MTGLVPSRNDQRDRFQCECYLCGTIIDQVTNGNGTKQRRGYYLNHLWVNHAAIGLRARSELADAMLRHERKVALR